MIRAASRALAQLFDRTTFGVLLISTLGAVLVLAACWFGMGVLLDHVHLFDATWLDRMARAAVGLGVIFATVALFGSIAAMIASLMIDRIAGRIEKRYYPGLPVPRSQSFGEAFRLGLSFLAVAAILNLLALPLYAVWGANVPIFLILNGYLLGREYFELVAIRRFDRLAVVELRRAHRGRLFIGGMAIAAFSLLPFANLLAPVVASAFMLHLFYDLPECRIGLPRKGVR